MELYEKVEYAFQVIILYSSLAMEIVGCVTKRALAACVML